MSEATSRERHLEQQVQSLSGRVSDLKGQNDALTTTLKSAKAQIVGLREDLDALASPPLTLGLVLRLVGDGTADVSLSGRRIRTLISSEVDTGDLRPGR